MCEDAPCCGCCGDVRESEDMREQYEAELAEAELADDGEEHGWPGDGSGLDDLADYNQNEADDYQDE